MPWFYRNEQCESGQTKYNQLAAIKLDNAIGFNIKRDSILGPIISISGDAGPSNFFNHLLIFKGRKLIRPLPRSLSELKLRYTEKMVVHRPLRFVISPKKIEASLDGWEHHSKKVAMKAINLGG